MKKIINAFPGYEYIDGQNMYMGENVGRGGYVYAEKGIWGNVALLDIQSMHPNSIINMNCFGQYTPKYKELMDARLAIKHGDYESARGMLGGKLAPYLDDPSDAKALSDALKTAINSVYGLTSASFDNPFRDSRNENNIVALRGALFMVTLKHEVQKRGYSVVHIKTDSIKIADQSDEIVKFCMDFAADYGYSFEFQAIYDKMCLVNDAVYIAKIRKDFEDPSMDGQWTATGAQFQHPYVFKTMFSKKPIVFNDLCEIKSVSTALYLDMNENLPEGEHNYHFIGKVGRFCPMIFGCGGGELLRQINEGKYSSATGAKGYRWMESNMVKNLKLEDKIDYGYFNHLVDDASKAISNLGDLEWFCSEDEYTNPPFNAGPLKGAGY